MVKRGPTATDTVPLLCASGGQKQRQQEQPIHEGEEDLLKLRHYCASWEGRGKDEEEALLLDICC